MPTLDLAALNAGLAAAIGDGAVVSSVMPRESARRAGIPCDGGRRAMNIDRRPVVRLRAVSAAGLPAAARAVVPLALVLVADSAFALYRTSGLVLRYQGESTQRAIYRGMVTFFLAVGAFMAVSNVISADRLKGHFRFLFSKPVNVVA